METLIQRRHPTVPTDSPRISVIGSEAELVRLAAEWPLEVPGPPGGPFRSHAWLHAWWRHLGRATAHAQLETLVARDAHGALQGLLPLYRERLPLLGAERL